MPRGGGGAEESRVQGQGNAPCVTPSSAFNNILSNLGYILLGLLFLLIILQREINHNRALLRNDLYALVREHLPTDASAPGSSSRSAQPCPAHEPLHTSFLLSVLWVPSSLPPHLLFPFPSPQ